MNESPTVFIIDDDVAIREGISDLVKSIGLQAVTFASALEFIDHYQPDMPGCLLLDVRLPRLSGLELQALLPQHNIEIPVIMMSAFGEVAVAVQAMKAGAVDFVEKPCSGQGLLDRIHRAIAIDSNNRQRRRGRAEARKRLVTLSAREREVLDGILDGKANKVIALDLGISEKTVEARRSAVMQKMLATSVAELVQLALLANQ